MSFLRRIKLHWWILLGMVAGLFGGLGLHYAYYDAFLETARFEILGESFTEEEAISQARLIQAEVRSLMDGTFWGSLTEGVAEAFLALLRMVVIPLVVASLISGVAQMGDMARLKRIGSRAAGWYLMTSFLAILTGLFLVNLIQPGRGVELPISLDGVEVPEPSGIWDMLLSVIPPNVVAAAANFELLPLIFFSMLFGIFALQIGEEKRRPVISFFEALFEIMLKMTLFVIALAPIGIAALIARLLATTGPDVLVGVAWYAVTVGLALVVHMLLVLPLLFWLLTRRNPYLLLHAMSATLVTAFSTASSAGTLGMTLEQTENRVGVDNKVGGFVLPLGATINMDGTALYECVAVLFVAQLYMTANPEFALTFGTQITIVVLALMVSIGAAGIPHAGLVMMVIIFEAVGLPLELVALLWAVDRPLDMMRTMVNVWSDTVGTVTIAHHENAIDENVLFGPGKAALT